MACPLTCQAVSIKAMLASENCNSFMRAWVFMWSWLNSTAYRKFLQMKKPGALPGWRSQAATFDVRVDKAMSHWAA